MDDLIRRLLAHKGASRSEDLTIYVVEGSPAELELGRLYEVATEAERGELHARVIIFCGPDSPSHDRKVEGLASVSPPKQRAELLRSIGKAPPRVPTKGEREFGHRGLIGNLPRWLSYRRQHLKCGVRHRRARRRGPVRIRGSRRGVRRSTGSGSRAGPGDLSDADDDPSRWERR